jgi:translation initiation factor IF-3
MLKRNQNLPKKNQNLPNINDRIRFPEIRLIDAEGNELGIMPPSEAMQIAKEQELDLVLLSDKAEPPVCRVIDYGKFKFDQQKKQRKARKNQHTSKVKEVKMRYKIEEHDYNVRVNRAEKFIKDGDKVKATITFRGRERQHEDLAEDLLKRMANDLKETADIQQAPKREGHRMMMLLAPKR